MKVARLSGLSQQPLSLCFVADVQYQDVMAQVMPQENFCHTEGKKNNIVDKYIVILCIREITFLSKKSSNKILIYPSADLSLLWSLIHYSETFLFLFFCL